MFSTATNKSPVAFECPGALNDSPSDVAWFWAGGSSFPLLAASAWDGSVTVWEVQTNKPLLNTPTGGTLPAEGSNDPAPTALNAIVAGTLDKRVMMIKLANNEVVQVGKHEAWVRRVFFDERAQSIVSISYDGTVKWWNGTPNSPAPVHSISFQGKIVDADMNKDLLVLMTEDSKLTVYSLANLMTAPKTIAIPQFSYPLACVRLFTNGQGVCVGTVEGRARIITFMGKTTDDFTFRCQRIDDAGELIPSSSVAPEKHNVYSVNSVDFNPIYDTLMTSGGDGHVITWDKDNRVKLQAGPKMPGSLTCIKFDISGRLCAVGIGYDWHMGIAGKQSKIMPNKVVVLAVPDSWIKRKHK